jgi:hypothetical protein
VYDLVVQAGSAEANGVRARDGGRYGGFAGLPAVAGKPVHVAFDAIRNSWRSSAATVLRMEIGDVAEFLNTVL